jgi:carbonic anhydrase/SulP family sulfate permease
MGAATIGLLSILLLVFWDKCKPLKKSNIPAPLIVVLLGVAISELFRQFGGEWVIKTSHLVQVPVAASVAGFLDFLQLPDFSQWNNPAVYMAAITIAIVASLETLLNLEAVDKIDPKQRVSPASRELFAQGVGNICVGMIGGLPVTSVIVRSSVNIHAGGQTKLSAIFHGTLLLSCVAFLPAYLNLIPLSCLAAILLVTGIKLASPALVRQMWSQGRYQFIPFAATVVSIVLTDLLIGIMIGLAVSLAFILYSNMRRPLHRIVETHLGGEVVHIELANQVSFLNRAALDKVFNEIPRGGHVLLDARHTSYIDPDILSMIRDYKEISAPVRGVNVSLRGFRERYDLQDEIRYVDYSTRELQGKLTPAQVLQFLKEGNERFRNGHRLTRNLGRQWNAMANGQHPLAVVHSCIDSRTPTELIFDLGMGDIFSSRIAGNVISPMALGSMEYSCAVAGAKLILVLGHTRCGAVTAAVDTVRERLDPDAAMGCNHMHSIVNEIQPSIDLQKCKRMEQLSCERKLAMVDAVARRNALHSVEQILTKSPVINRLVREGTVAVVGGMYDVVTGSIEFLTDEPVDAYDYREAEDEAMM